MPNPLPGSEPLLAERALARLEAAGPQGLAVAELWQHLEQGGDVPPAVTSAALGPILARLAAAGRAVESEGRWLAVAASTWRSGVVELLDDGDAAIHVGPGRGEAAWFVRRRNLKGALPGDTVLVRPLARHRGAGGGSGSRLPHAVVEKVVAARQEVVVGTTEADERRRRWLVPFDVRAPLELEVLGAEDLTDRQFVAVAIERRQGGSGAVGRVVEVLGDPDLPGVDVKVVLRHYGIPDEFPPAVLAAADAFPADPPPADCAGREDLRGRTVITIDGETARDFDDAVSIERLPGGIFRLGVHIADVAHYVGQGSALDLEAYRRGTSVYYPDRAVPMLPEGLSNGLCSLRPNVPRLTLSAFLDVDRDGVVVARRFAETVIQSSRRMTYAEVRRLLEQPAAGDREEYGPVLPMLNEMRHLMEILLHARSVRGSIDFDLPEGNVELATDGTVVGIVAGQRNVAHRIIEEFMIAANEAVAYELDTRGLPALYRVHDAPSPQRLEELREVLANLGIELRGEIQELHPSFLQEVLRQVEGKPEEQFVSTVVLRTMQRAHYSPECRGHYALASRYYAHFTSPIRRYPDLVVHRGLKALLHGRAKEEAALTLLAERLPQIAEHASTTERRAERSERDLLQWKKVRFLADRVGERFPGRITGVQPFGLFVQLDDYYVDGLVPVRTLGDDFYRYEPDSHRLVGERTAKAFRLADSVEVDLVGVDLRRRGLELQMAGAPAAAGDRPSDPSRPNKTPGTRRPAGTGARRPKAPEAGRPAPAPAGEPQRERERREREGRDRRRTPRKRR